MIIISHRGNTNGYDTNNENKPSYILATNGNGFDVEIDVWFYDDLFYLGHENPTYKVDVAFLQQTFLWCHAKNIEALYQMLKYDIHCFWHQNDDVVLTSKQYIWTFPGKSIVGSRSIAVLPEQTKQWNIANAYGVCTDYALDFRNQY